MTAPLLLDAAALAALAQQARAPLCDSCKTLPSTGWEAMPSSLDRARLEQVGTLAAAGDDQLEPTLDEYHPDGTRYWSALAPIAPAWFPANRCGVWRCRRCATVLLRYVEHGGYFEEERVRRVLPALVALDAPTPGKT
jgi:hypothetical protein